MHNDELKSFTVFCEDVRSEANNKISMIGCVQDTLFIAHPFPTNIRLNAVCHIFLPKDRKMEGKLLYLNFPNTKQKSIDLSTLPPSEGSNYVRVIIDLTPFVFEAEGKVEFFLGTIKGEKTLIGELAIQSSPELKTFPAQNIPETILEMNKNPNRKAKTKRS